MFGQQVVILRNSVGTEERLGTVVEERFVRLRISEVSLPFMVGLLQHKVQKTHHYSENYK